MARGTVYGDFIKRNAFLGGGDLFISPSLPDEPIVLVVFGQAVASTGALEDGLVPVAQSNRTMCGACSWWRRCPAGWQKGVSIILSTPIFTVACNPN